MNTENMLHTVLEQLKTEDMDAETALLCITDEQIRKLGPSPERTKFLKLADKFRKTKIFARAENAAEVALARENGADGISLFPLEDEKVLKDLKNVFAALGKLPVSFVLPEGKGALCGVRANICQPGIAAQAMRCVLSAMADFPKVKVQFIVPGVCDVCEIAHQKMLLEQVAAEAGLSDLAEKCRFGALIDNPRGAYLAETLALEAASFIFEPQRLTELMFGVTKEESVHFMECYLSKNILDADPFESMDMDGVALMIYRAAMEGKSVKARLTAGVTGDPDLASYAHEAALDQLIVPADNVAAARLAAAQAVILYGSCDCGCEDHDHSHHHHHHHDHEHCHCHEK